MNAEVGSHKYPTLQTRWHQHSNMVSDETSGICARASVELVRGLSEVGAGAGFGAEARVWRTPLTRAKKRRRRGRIHHLREQTAGALSAGVINTSLYTKCPRPLASHRRSPPDGLVCAKPAVICHLPDRRLPARNSESILRIPGRAAREEKAGHGHENGCSARRRCWRGYEQSHHPYQEVILLSLFPYSPTLECAQCPRHVRRNSPLQHQHPDPRRTRQPTHNFNPQT